MPAGEVRLIACPFHNGLEGVVMGAGAALLAADAAVAEAVERAGARVSRARVETVDPNGPEIARSMEIVRRLAREVRLAVEDGAFPLVLAGNCHSSLATAAGSRADGVVWLDAHADFDDPDDNVSGFFDVMALAMLTGRGWRTQRATIPDHRPVPEGHVVLAAVRDLAPYQRERVERSELLVVPGDVDAGAYGAALSLVAERASRVYLHVDLDSLDAGEARVNAYAAAGGPSLERLRDCVHAAFARTTVAAAAITSFDPSCDDDGRALGAARVIAGDIAAGATSAVEARELGL